MYWRGNQQNCLITHLEICLCLQAFPDRRWRRLLQARKELAGITKNEQEAQDLNAVGKEWTITAD